MLERTTQSCIFAEIHDLNRAFIATVSNGDSADPSAAFGMSSDIVDRLQGLDAQALEWVAQTPVLLPAVRLPAPGAPADLNDDSPVGREAQRPVAALAVMIVTWLRQSLFFRALETQILSGLGPEQVARISTLPCAEILPLCERGNIAFVNRFGVDSPFWIRMTLAAERKSADDLEQAWLSAVQLGYSLTLRDRRVDSHRPRRFDTPGLQAMRG